MDLVSVVIPVYNEEEAIAGDLELIERTMDASGLPYELIVVNDGSTDRTVEIVSRFPRVRLLHHERNKGNGAARTTGMKAARGDVVIMSDGDGTYPNQDMPKLLRFLEEKDANGDVRYPMVIGARIKEKGTIRWLRTPAKWFIRKLASYLTETEIPDLNSGLRAFRKDLAMRYLNILPNTHSWVSTITIAFLSDGLGVKFVPIDYYTRKGHSKFHPLRDTYNYLTLVVRAVTYFNPIKVFLPLSLGMFGVGLVKALYDIVAYRFHFAPSTLLVLLTALQIGAVGLLADLVARRARQ